jgi:hypothetical protein
MATVSINHYSSIEFDLDTHEAYSINITHYEHERLFYAQLTDLFETFDAHFDEFQAYCDKQSPLNLADIKSALQPSTSRQMRRRRRPLASRPRSLNNLIIHLRQQQQEQLRSLISGLANTSYDIANTSYDKTF